MRFVVVILLNFACWRFAGAGLLHFRPLSAQQVYNVLRVAKREDAIPQGRVITQGLAAMSGFAAGIATGIGVPLVFNIDLANVTGITSWLSSLNSGNWGGSSITGGSSSSATSMQTQEICFNSRAANDISDNDDNAADDNDAVLAGNESESGRSYQPYLSGRRGGRAMGKFYLLHKRNVPEQQPRYFEEAVEFAGTGRQADGSPTTTNAETDAAATPTTNEATGATSPTNTDTASGTNSVTTADNGGGTGTESQTTTDTGNSGAVNCIVIQKPGNA